MGKSLGGLDDGIDVVDAYLLKIVSGRCAWHRTDTAFLTFLLAECAKIALGAQGRRASHIRRNAHLL
jgi:hypothetical protein